METTTGTTTVKLHGASAKSFANAIDELKSLGAIFDPEDKTWTLDGALVIGTDGTGETVVRHDSDPLNSLCFMSRLYRGGCLDIEVTEPEAVTDDPPAERTSLTGRDLPSDLEWQHWTGDHSGCGEDCEFTRRLPTECLVCRDADGNVVLTDCPNRCDAGLIYDDEEG